MSVEARRDARVLIESKTGSLEVRSHEADIAREARRDMRRVFRRQVLVGGIGLLLAVLIVGIEMSRFDWDPTAFTSFGEDATTISSYAQERLGEVWLRPEQGHDGRFFFVQANDPWLRDPLGNAAILDRPAYRSQRMLYPVLASGMGVLGPESIVWGLLIVNLLAMGLGSWAAASIATEMGGSAWWGLAFVLNLGLVTEMNIDGAGVVAAATAFLAVALMLRGRSAWATAMLVLAALSREVMLVVAAGTAWWLWHSQGQRRRAITVLVIPIAIVGLWYLYIQLVGLENGLAEIQEIGIPFVGIIGASSSWLDDPLNLTIGVTVALLLLLFARRVVVQDELVGWAFLGFVPVAFLLTEQVWHSYFDIARAVAPVFTAYALLIAADRRNVREPHGDPGGSVATAGTASS